MLLMKIYSISMMLVCSTFSLVSSQTQTSLNLGQGQTQPIDPSGPLPTPSGQQQNSQSQSQTPIVQPPSNQQLTPSGQQQNPQGQSQTPIVQPPSNQQLTPSGQQQNPSGQQQNPQGQSQTPIVQPPSNQQLTPSGQQNSFGQLQPSNQIQPQPQLFNQPQQQTQQALEKYAVVVDCGSSGSRVQIYHWPSNTPIGDIPYVIEPVRDSNTGKPLSASVRPGLSVVRDNPSSASDYMRGLMQFASFYVPKQLHAQTPVYFWGTAGLRMLSDHEQRQILEDIARDIKSEFDFQQIETKVISGSDEGIFRWLSTNAAANRLDREYNQAPNNQFLLQQSKARRYGIIEMGGSSAQVTFEVSSRLEELIKPLLVDEAQQTYQNSKRLVQLPASTYETRTKTPYNQKNNYNLLSVTFSGFGSDSARNLAIDLLVHDKLRQQSFSMPSYFGPQTSIVVQDPCLPVGAEDIIQKPYELLVSASNPQTTKTIGYDPKPGDQTFNIRLVGQGNYAFCRALLNRMVLIAKTEKTNCQVQSTSNNNNNQFQGLNGNNNNQFQFQGSNIINQPQNSNNQFQNQGLNNNNQFQFQGPSNNNNNNLFQFQGPNSNNLRVKMCESSLIGSRFIPWTRLQFVGLSELFYSTSLMMQASGKFNGLIVQANTIRICATPYQTLRNQYPFVDQTDIRRTKLQCFKASWLLTYLQMVLLMPMSPVIDTTMVDNIEGKELEWTIGALLTEAAKSQQQVQIP